MRVIRMDTRDAGVCLASAICILAACAFIAGCGNGESEQADGAAALLGEMKAWFEAMDHEAYGYASLEEALDDTYQDEGYTSTLYRNISAELAKSETDETTARPLLGECQEWFELIDYEMSGYDSLEEAIEDIFQDGGETLGLYKRIAKFNE